MKDILRPVLELLVVLPGLLLGYFPVKTYLKQSPGRLAAWLFPLMACLCIGSGLACYRLGASTFLALAGVALAAICLYTRTLTISLWKSGTIALSVCAVFACVNSLSRAVSAAIIRDLQLPPDGPWLCLGACVFYNAVCWVIVLAAYYPATHLDMCFCENRAADSVVGYYCAMAKRDEIPFRARLDLPETLPIDEIDMCLVLSNLLENALEASLRTAPGRRQIEITACVHADRILLIEVENAFDGEVNEKNGVFRSSKRRENGIGIQSVTRIAEKTGGTSTFTHQNGTFTAKVMLCG